MLHAVQNFLPIMTSDAGLCLTAANWQEVNITSIALYLDSLLLKPGYELLKKIPNLSAYMGWSGAIILNAASLAANKEGIFTITSTYDGSKLKLTYAQLIEIILHLKPNAVILPRKIVQEFPQIWENWDESITPIIGVDDLLKQEVHRVHGVYFHWDNSLSRDAFLEQLKRWSHLPRYVTGHLSLELMTYLKEEGIEFLESNEPAASGMQGKVFCRKGVVDLTEDSTAMQFEVIDGECACPTCSQQLTKAYLHHLFLHTPLLCQRFLIQHNVYYALSYSGN
ncbi:queuine tRNA-ribosyltransferase family protein [Legionella maioricensis]|uniref:Queuine tRNA-ribosyltransferase family protein n=1 Tax=Legionella maioricensis TaxID=2896528 RepID=A0A9X2I910_9GAMM|nr:queuine tRNA-ribosyltransferase family protein [Legionella maioricensis]MCL9682730.1 queuine tRNA-ribosyltransferase family protein [Legionella maioricensis]MCL9687222.1 queuine tRNA-ribosyltransferase family protein [Legionella maioricensis]